MTKIFVIVLNFNGKSVIGKCLKVLEKEKARIIVVDNGSFDRSPEMIKKNFSKIKIIENNKNLGFAAGNNVGLRYALRRNASAIMLLNQDTIVKKGFLELLLKNTADIIGPVIKFKRKRKWLYDYGGRINWLIGRTSHQEVVGGRLSKRLNFHDPDYISGCAMLVKRPVFEKVGIFDERFFLYFEDVDFCQRAKRAGFKIGVEPKAIILHKLIEGKKKSFFQIYHLIRSNLIFINRYIFFWKRPLAYLYWWSFSVKMLLMKLL